MTATKRNIPDKIVPFERDGLGQRRVKLRDLCTITQEE